MGGIELQNGVLRVDRDPTALDELALDVSAVLSDVGVDHAIVAGYVAVLAGRSRGTEDIDVILGPLSADRASAVADALSDAGFWGSAMPLSDLHSMLSDGSNLRVAREDEVIPNVELTYATDEFDRASVEDAIIGRIGDRSLPVGPLELGIAYKLFLDTRRDFEDAVHLYTMFDGSLSTEALEEWVEKLDVEDAYDRLRRA